MTKMHQEIIAAANGLPRLSDAAVKAAPPANFTNRNGTIKPATPADCTRAAQGMLCDMRRTAADRDKHISRNPSHFQYGRVLQARARTTLRMLCPDGGRVYTIPLGGAVRYLIARGDTIHDVTGQIAEALERKLTDAGTIRLRAGSSTDASALITRDLSTALYCEPGRISESTP